METDPTSMITQFMAKMTSNWSRERVALSINNALGIHKKSEVRIITRTIHKSQLQIDCK